MSCRTTQFELASWSDIAEFRDETALHLDSCARCRSAFDGAFPPIPVRRRSRHYGVVMVVALAAVVVGVFVTPVEPDAHSVSLGECIVDVEPWSPPECELG